MELTIFNQVDQITRDPWKRNRSVFCSELCKL